MAVPTLWQTAALSTKAEASAPDSQNKHTLLTGDRNNNDDATALSACIQSLSVNRNKWLLLLLFFFFSPGQCWFYIIWAMIWAFVCSSVACSLLKLKASPIHLLEVRTCTHSAQKLNEEMDWNTWLFWGCSMCRETDMETLLMNGAQVSNQASTCDISPFRGDGKILPPLAGMALSRASPR